MNKTIKECTFWGVFFITLLVWLSLDDIQANKSYQQSLERVVANCFDGKAVTVGEKIYLCGMTDIGEKRI